MTPRGHLDSRRLAFPPNCSKALPPNPPVHPYLKRSSSVYSQGTEPCCPQPLILDKSSQLSLQPSPPRLSYKKLSVARLPQGNSIETIQTQRPLSKPIQQPLLLGPSGSTYDRAFPPSPIEVEMFSPVTTRCRQVYSGFWLENILPAPIGPRLLEPFDPQFLCEQNDFAREARAYSRSNNLTWTGLKYSIPPRRSMPGNFGNTNKDTAAALSLVYQCYFTDDFEGELGRPQKQTEDKTPQVKVEKELGPLSLDGRSEIKASQRYLRPTPLKRVPVAKTAHVTHLSHVTSQEQRPSLPTRTLDLKEAIIRTELQQASHITVDGMPRRSKGGSESPVLALGGYAPYTASALSDNGARTRLDWERSNASAPDFLSVERRPVTVPRESNYRGGILPLQAELDHTPCRSGGVYESRFSVDSLNNPGVGALYQPLTSFSPQALPSFLTKILPYRSPNLKGRREGRQTPKCKPIDISPDLGRGGRQSNRLKDVEGSNWL